MKERRLIISVKNTTEQFFFLNGISWDNQIAKELIVKLKYQWDGQNNKREIARIG